MKIYSNVFDLAFPSPNRFWVAPNSDFKIGIKIENKGQSYAGSFALKLNGETVSPDETTTAGFKTYTVQSQGTGSVIYSVEVPDAQQKFTLVQIVTDSTVFDVGGSGGDVPTDVATKSWVESQISDFVDEDALTAFYTKTETSSANELSTAFASTVEGGAETGTIGTPDAVNAVKSVYETDWSSISATADASTLYIVLPDLP